MGHHLTPDNKFKSDKYDWCPEGFFALKLTDPVARKAALFYAAHTDDAELADDLRIAMWVVDMDHCGCGEVRPKLSPGDRWTCVCGVIYSNLSNISGFGD